MAILASALNQHNQVGDARIGDLSNRLTGAGDLVCTFLGSRTPMILREVSPSRFGVIGHCYIYGLQDGEGILGPLPPHWKVVFTMYTLGRLEPKFLDTSTNNKTILDPHLGPLAEPWGELTAVRTPDDPAIFARFRNKQKGEVMNSDPRMLPGALRARGVPLKAFRLV